MQRQDIDIVRGDSWSELKVRWLDADDNPIHIASARMQIRTSADAPDPPQLELTSTAGLTIDGTSWYITPAITPAQSADLQPGVYDIEATAVDGRIRTLVGGQVNIIADVTR